MKLNLRKKNIKKGLIMSIDFITLPLRQYNLSEKAPNILFWNMSDEVYIIRELYAN